MHVNIYQPNTDIKARSVQNKATTWAQVYDNYAPMIYGIIVKMTDDDKMAGDILSEVFVALSAQNKILEINSLICLRCAYKTTLKYFQDRGLMLSKIQPFNQNCPLINLFYVQGMSLEKIVIDLEVTKDEALNKLRAELNYLRSQR